MVAGLGLYSHFGRFVPAAEVALLALSEVALGPFWVWLLLDETPSALSLAGGAVVLGAVVAQVLLGGRPRPIPPAAG
jgi:drug/metabolite transporter (DMT)-like permease